MPVYNFLCDKCDHITSDIQPMKRDNEYEKCPCEECGGETEHTLQSVGNNRIFGDKERISSALGVHPSQIADGSVFKVHPGANFDHDGNMILKNRTEQKRRLKERGWVNKDSYC